MNQPGMHLGGMQRNQTGDPALQYQIIQELQNERFKLPPGWQQTHDPRDRATRILELITQLRLLQPDISKSLGVARNFETRSFLDSSSKEEYIQKVKQKLDDIMVKRQNMASVQGNAMAMHFGQNGGMMHPGMNGMQNMQPQNGFGHAPVGFPNTMGAMPGMMGNNQIGIANMNNGVDPQQAFNAARLQRQMQPTPIPHQISQATQNNVMDTNALQAAHNLQAPDMGHSASQQPPTDHLNNAQGGNVNTQPTHQDIMNMARTLYTRMPDEQKNALRTKFLGSLTDQQREQARTVRGDPLMKWFVQKARDHLLRTAQAQQQLQSAAQAQRGLQQGNVGGGQNIDFTSIMAQQANALKSQESGEQVVPPSNNPNFNLGNLVGMPQGMNPQMMNGQNNQAANNQQMQLLMAQHKEQQRIQRTMQQQNMANQQAPQLRGQPGGLNAPNVLNGGSAAQLNSPAMSMLNRPMAPPGQNNPIASQQTQSAAQAAQQNRSQATQAAAREASQLQQHHQQMMNQNQNKGDNSQLQAQQQQTSQQNQTQQQQLQQRQQQQQQQQQQQMQKMMQLMQSIPPEMKEKLSGMTPAEAQAYFRSRQPTPQQSIVQGDFNIMGSSTAQSGPFSGMPTNPNSAGQGLNGQILQGQQGIMDSQLVLQQRLQQQQIQAAQMKQRAMDIRPYPRGLLSSLQFTISIPDNIKAWGQLKEFVRQNAAMMPGMNEKLQSAQAQWFTLHPNELAAGVQAIRAHIASQQGIQSGSLQNAQMGRVGGVDGQAMAAQMLTPGAQMQMANAGGLNGMQNPGLLRAPGAEQVTPQEVQAFRARYGQSTNLNDDQIRQLIWKRKVEASTRQAAQEQMFQQQQQQQQQQAAMRNAQMQRAQASANAALQINGAMGNPVQAFANQLGAMPPAQMQPQKRPQTGSDDVIEISDPNILSKTAPAQSALPPNPYSVPTGVPKGFPSMEQLEKMTQQQRQIYMNQFQHYKQRQAALNQSTGRLGSQPTAVPMHVQPSQKGQMESVSLLQLSDVEVRQKMAAILAEVQKTAIKGPPVELDAAGQAQARMLLKKLWSPLSRIQDTFVLALRAPNVFSEARIREIMEAKALIAQNIADQNGNFREYLSLTIGRLKEIEGLVQAYLTDVKTFKERIDQARARTQAAPGSAQPVAANAALSMQAATKTTTPNTQQERPMGRTASQQDKVRKQSSSSKVPAAPIDNKSHDWGALSPHGVPKYETGRPELTPDKLIFPPQKKRRVGQAESPASTTLNQAGTPGTAGAAATATKKSSPETLRKAPPPSQAGADVKVPVNFRCQDMWCEANISGFATEEELNKHKSTNHKAIGDPLAFFMDSAAKSLEMYKDGASLDTSTAKSAATKVGGVSSSDGVRQKERVGASNKPGTAVSITGDTDKTTFVPAPEQTLRMAMMENVGIETTLSGSTTVQVTDDPKVQLLSAGNLVNIEGLDDWAQLVGADDWRVSSTIDSPPNLTPGDVNSLSSQGSDVSQSDRLRINFEWDAFGNGDTFVPDSLQIEALGLDDAIPTIALEAVMADDTIKTDVAGANAKSDDSTWDWSGDFSQGWESYFKPEPPVF